MRPSTPVMVSAEVRALIMDSSTASATPSKRGLMWSKGNIFTSRGWESSVMWLPVEKAMKMSPLPLCPEPPARERPTVARLARRWHWMGSRGASVATTMMIDPPPDTGLPGERGDLRTDFKADGDAIDAEVGAGAVAVVGLDQDADGELPALGVHQPGGGADASFEVVAEHAGTTADVAFGRRTAGCRGYGLEDVFFGQMEGVDVVEEAIVGLGDDGQEPAIGLTVFDGVRDDAVAYQAYLMGVGDAYH